MRSRPGSEVATWSALVGMKRCRDMDMMSRHGWQCVSRPDSRSDPISGSERSSGCETQDWDSLPDFFFFKSELVPIGIAHIL